MKPLLDKHRLADLLGVSVSWVEKATAARAIPITWVGRYARYDQDDIAAWLDSRKEPADRPATVLSVIGPKRPAPTPSPPPAKPKPPAGPVKPKPPAGPRRVDTAA